MTDVSAGNNENFESLLKRFNRKVQQSGVLSDLKNSEYYEKPGEKRKKKDDAGRRKARKTTRQ